MSLDCTRRIQFCAGHRVMGHENKCAHLHGHNYVAFFKAEAMAGVPELDEIGRVVDFSVLKKEMGGWIEHFWDHGFILSAEDVEALEIIQYFPVRPFEEQKLYIMDDNPTAENMARHLLKKVAPKLFGGEGIRIVSVRIWETENCYAEASL